MLKKTVSQIASSAKGTAFREPSMVGYIAVIGKLGYASGQVSPSDIANRLYTQYPGANDTSKKSAVGKVFKEGGSLIAFQPRDPGAKAYLFVTHPNGSLGDTLVGGQVQTADAPALAASAASLVSLVPDSESESDMEISGGLSASAELLNMLLSNNDWIQGTIEDFEVLRKGADRVW